MPHPPPHRKFPGHKVSITATGFVPDRIECKQNATVTFTNNDDKPHGVTIFVPMSPVPVTIDPGKSFDYVASVPPGEYSFDDYTVTQTGTLKVT